MVGRQTEEQVWVAENKTGQQSINQPINADYSVTDSLDYCMVWYTREKEGRVQRSTHGLAQRANRFGSRMSAAQVRPALRQDFGAMLSTVYGLGQ